MRKITRLTSLLIAVLFASTLVFAQNNTMTTSATKPVDAKEAKTEIKNASISVYQPFIEKKTSSKPYDPAMHPSPRQGGDDIASSLEILSLPFSATGTTSGYTDNYDAICPYNAPGSPDVVYSYTPTSNGFIDISLCNDLTDYDTKLYVYDTPAPSAGDEIACNDDACSTLNYPDPYVSQILGVEVFSGTTYYIVVDGYGGDFGNYEITVTQGIEPILLDCPVDAVFSLPASIGYNSAATSDVSPGFKVFNFFNGVEDITSIRWWGVSGYNDGTDWLACTEDPRDFQVEFWNNDAGLPDIAGGSVASYSASISGIPTGNFFLGWEIYEYNLIVSETMSSGWISIWGNPEGIANCWFMWLNTLETGIVAQQLNISDNTFTATTQPMSMCLSGTLPACPPPTGLYAENFTTTTALLGWTPGGSESLWNVEVGLPGFTPGTLTAVASVYGSNENPWTAKELDPGTTYVYYVQADCGAKEESSWAGPYTFTTLCEFECPTGSIAETEACGDTINNGCNLVITQTFESVNPGDIICGTVWAEGGSRDTDWFELILAEPSQVILHAYAETELFFGLVEGIDPANPDCADLTGFINPVDFTDICSPVSLDLGVLIAGTHWFFAGLPVFEGYPCDIKYWIEFEVIEVECAPPTDLTATNITATSADLGWTPGGTEAMWHVEVGVPGFAPGTGTALLSDYFTPDNPWLASPLNPGMDYEFYVKAYCNGFENPKIDRFWMAMPGFGVLDPLLSGGTMDDPGETGEWYFYENAPLQPWWNIWFYNGEFVPENMKKVRMGFWVQSLDGINPGEIQFVVNWSTPEWSLLPDPPTPFPMPMDEFYIERSPINPPMIVDPVGPQWIEFYYIIEDYNPEWISVDIWGANIQILEEYLIPPPPESALAEFWTPGPGGIIVHECLPKDHSSSEWSGPLPFSTLCLPVDVPFCENFDGVTAPAIPDCWTVTNDNDDTNLWETDTSNPNSAPNAMAILYNTTLAMDDWFFSPGLNLEGGVTYQVDFFYSAASASYPEALEVRWGTYPNAAGMTGGLIWDNNSIINETYELGTGTFTPPTTGVYYVGWHGYSAADQFILYVDDICIAEEEPEVPENRTVDGVTISDLDDECFDATNTITVTNTVVESGGIANFIAGVNIIFGEGFIVENGGYMWARIDNVYCNPPALLSAIEEAPEVMLPEITASESFFKVFPNPTTSTFKLELLGADEAAIINVEIYGMMGERVFQDVLFGGLQYEFDLSNMPKGIYFIRVLMGDEMGIEKVIKQ